MLFNSYQFMIFFPIVIAIYFIIPRRFRYIWLLISSYYFYMSWNPKYAILIAISTVITYASGILIGSCGDSSNQARKKAIVAVSFVSNLSILVFFKYFDFLLENINSVLGVIGVSAIDKPFDIILPVGISFYTFQALSYTMDVYRGTVKAERNLLKYALFVSFFPQLVAGPIERSGNLLGQVLNMDRFKLWNYDRIMSGFMLMLWGLFQKMVIADRAAIFVDTVYDSYWMYGGVELVLATILFAVQIYCDFASYSTIAVGAARVMGFELMENFNTPYFAVSVKDFWRRWHISLSTWFKDYLYIPLGGNRCSTIKKYRNIFITFLVSGIWHGASWSFVAWGCLHGIYQIIGDIVRPVKERVTERFHVKTETFSWRLGQILVTFAFVDFAWIFFRTNSLRNSLEIISQIFRDWNPWVLFDKSIFTNIMSQDEIEILVISIVILLLADLIRYFYKKTVADFLSEQCLWFRWLVLFGMIMSIIIFGIYGPAFDAKQFIYFQF